MKRTSLLAGLVLLSACDTTPSPVAYGDDVRAQFETLKSLAGAWTDSSDGDDESSPVVTTYQLTNGGWTVVETMFGGTDHEMVSTYHIDGGQLVQTHYCSGGIQPRTVATSSSNPNSIWFRFLDTTNIDSGEDAHMHETRIEKKDADHVEEWWTAWKHGEADHTSYFVLTRKK